MNKIVLVSLLALFASNAHAVVAPIYGSLAKIQCALDLQETSQYLHMQAIQKLEIATNNVVTIQSTSCQVKIALDFNDTSNVCVSAKLVANKCTN